jgi:hypothetical protein
MSDKKGLEQRLRATPTFCGVLGLATALITPFRGSDNTSATTHSSQKKDGFATGFARNADS